MISDILENNELLISVLAVFISFISAIVSFFTFRSQQVHNVKMIKPILQVGQWDYENRLLIDLRNNGLGPAQVDKIRVINKQGKDRNSIFHWLPNKLPHGLNYSNYLTVHEKFILEQNANRELIEIRINLEDKKQVKYREKLRKNISELTIIINYSDVYGNKMPQLKLNFWMFSRIDNVN